MNYPNLNPKSQIYILEKEITNSSDYSNLEIYLNLIHKILTVIS
jgi:hypothetical protein